MKKSILLLGLLLVSAVLFADMTKSQLQRMYLDYLKTLGVSAKIDADGDIEFSYSGTHFDNLTYWIIVNEDDPQFFQIIKDGGYPLETAAQKRKAPLAASYSTRESYVVKMWINQQGTNIIAVAETLLVKPEDFKGIFETLMREMDAALYRFVTQMN